MDAQYDDTPADEPGSYGLICPFWIDTDAYTDRDRDMFVSGYEFFQVLARIRKHHDAYSSVIHRENESRVRMACARFGRQCRIEPWVSDDDPAGTWSFLEIEPRPES